MSNRTMKNGDTSFREQVNDYSQWGEKNSEVAFFKIDIFTYIGVN